MPPQISYGTATVTFINHDGITASDLKLDYAGADGSFINLYFTDTLSSSKPNPSRFRVTANKRRQRIDSITTDPREGVVSLNLRRPISAELDILISYSDLNGDQATGCHPKSRWQRSFIVLQPRSDQQFDRRRSSSLDDAYLDGKELVLEFDELLQAGKLSKSRFKVRAGKKRIRVISAEVPKDDAVAILNLQKATPSATNNLTLTYKDLKGDQSSLVIQDLNGNYLPSIKNFAVEIL